MKKLNKFIYACIIATLLLGCGEKETDLESIEFTFTKTNLIENVTLLYTNSDDENNVFIFTLQNDSPYGVVYTNYLKIEKNMGNGWRSWPYADNFGYTDELNPLHPHSNVKMKIDKLMFSDPFVSGEYRISLNVAWDNEPLIFVTVIAHFFVGEVD